MNVKKTREKFTFLEGEKLFATNAEELPEQLPDRRASVSCG
jgi:hypothetical protein